LIEVNEERLNQVANRKKTSAW